MTDIATFATVALVLGIAAAWWAVLRRRPRRPKAVAHDETTFTRPEDV